MAGKTVLLKWSRSQDIHQPVMLNDPPESVYIPNVISGVRSGEVRTKFLLCQSTNFNSQELSTHCKSSNAVLITSMSFSPCTRPAWNSNTLSGASSVAK